MISLKHGIVHLRLENKKIKFQQKKEERGRLRRGKERRGKKRRGESDGASLVDLQLEWTFSLVQETTQGWSLGDELGWGATNLSRTRPSLIKTHLSNITSETPQPSQPPICLHTTHMWVSVSVFVCYERERDAQEGHYIWTKLLGTWTSCVD